jgi:hypothetical protein
MTCSGGGDQLDLIAHDGNSSDFLATGTHFRQHGIDTFFIDSAHTFGGQAQLYKALFTFNPKPMGMKIRQKPATGFIVRVRHIITGGWTLAGHLADSGHREYPLTDEI